MLNEIEIQSKYQDCENEYRGACNQYSGKTNEGLKNFLEEIQQYKPLPRDKANSLIISAQTGNTESKNIVVNSMLKFVVCIAKKYFTQDIEPMDLIFEGILGITDALEKFEVSRNLNFSTYAYYHINGKIVDYLNSHYNLSNVPPRLYSLARNVNNFKSKYFEESGEYPTEDIILKSLRISEKELKKAEKFSRSVVSIDEKINDTDGLTIGDLIASESDEFFENIYKKDDNEFKRERLKKHICMLSRNERIVLIYSYGLFDKKIKTTEQIAGYLKVGKRCVEQTKYRAQTKLYLSLQSDVDLYF